MLGVAVGALVRSQVVAIAVALVWWFLIENLVARLLVDGLYRDGAGSRPGCERIVTG